MSDLAIVLSLLSASIVMFAIGRPRMDVVALIMIVALPLSGVITVEQALAGFADPSIVLIAALFVVGEALVLTGVAQKLGDWLVLKAGRSEAKLITLLMIVVAAIGSFMSSTGVVAIFIPIVLRIVRNAGVSAARLMMPLSVAALLSGMMTLVATAPNLVVHGELVRNGFEGFKFFSFAPFGLPVLAFAVIYMLVARRFLNATGPMSLAINRPSLKDFVDAYALQGREFRLQVTPKSSVTGRALEELDLRGSAGINIVAIERVKRFSRRLLRPEAQTRLETGDVLLIDLNSQESDVGRIAQRYGLHPLPLAKGYFSDQTQEIGMAEVLVPPQSALVGKTVLKARFRTRHGLSVIGIKRGQSSMDRIVTDITLHAGDTMLLVGPWRAIQQLAQGSDRLILLNTPLELDDVAPQASRTPQAVAILLLTVVLMASGIVPTVIGALTGCLLFGLFGCIDMNAAYRSIHWQTLVLIVGMLPFSVALQTTGGTQLAADWLLSVVGSSSPRVVLTALFLTTATLGLFISNTATAVLMAPVAIALASALEASPYPFAMIVALSASAAFMTPVSSPVNMLVLGPGNYSFFDFVRIGVPFTLIAMATTVLLVPIVFPL